MTRKDLAKVIIASRCIEWLSGQQHMTRFTSGFLPPTFLPYFQYQRAAVLVKLRSVQIRCAKREFFTAGTEKQIPDSHGEGVHGAWGEWGGHVVI